MIMKKIIYISIGFISLGFAIFGIFIPILPTTPFLLLAAYFFAKSSDKFYYWLINSSFFGPYIRNYRERRGMTLIHKIIVLFLLWTVIITTIIYGTDKMWLRVFLGLVAIGVSTHIFMIKTLKDDFYAEVGAKSAEQETN